MTENDISALFTGIRSIATSVAGADLPDTEKQMVQSLVEASLRLLESALMDINRSANALEVIAMAEKANLGRGTIGG